MSNNVVKTLKQKIKARLKKISKHQSKLKALEKKLKKRKYFTWFIRSKALILYEGFAVTYIRYLSIYEAFSMKR
ncbi:MAG: hypothetical protein RSC68_16230 [Acinetobacter sp.]